MSDIFYALHLVLITREHIFIRSLYHSIHAAEFTQYFAAAFTLPHLCCSTHTTALFHSSHTAAALVPQLSRFNTWAATFMQQHSRSTYAAPQQQHPHSSTNAAELTQQRCFSALTVSHCSIYAATCTLQHFWSQHSWYSSHAAALTKSNFHCSLSTASFALQLSRRSSAGG